jgi:hypothetical protein
MSVPEVFMRDLISGAIGGSAYPVMAPDSARPPYAIYGRQSTNRDRNVLDSDMVPEAVFAVIGYAETYMATKTMAADIRAAMDNFTGTHSGCEILTVFTIDEADGQPVEYEGESKPAYTTEITFQIRYRET